MGVYIEPDKKIAIHAWNKEQNIWRVREIKQ